jgi:hypothetical protein
MLVLVVHLALDVAVPDYHVSPALLAFPENARCCASPGLIHPGVIVRAE